LRRGIQLAFGSLALCIASSAGAQESLDKDKTGAQLYASYCVTCHKSPKNLTKFREAGARNLHKRALSRHP
jgi:mono/diheme cytochrome c family protein